MSDYCDSMNHSPPGSSVHGIPQARILEWIAISFSRVSSQSRNRTCVSSLAGEFFTCWTIGGAHRLLTPELKHGEQMGERVIPDGVRVTERGGCGPDPMQAFCRPWKWVDFILIVLGNAWGMLGRSVTWYVLITLRCIWVQCEPSENKADSKQMTKYRNKNENPNLRGSNVLGR